MEHRKVLELEILKKLNETGKIPMIEIMNLFEWSEYSVVFNSLRNSSNFTESSEFIDGTVYYSFELNDFGRLKLKELIKEKADEEDSIGNKIKLGKDSSAVSNWTKAIGFMTIAILVIGILTLYFTCNPYHKEQMTIFEDTLPRIDTSAVRSDTTDKVEVINADGKVVKPDSATPPPLPPPTLEADRMFVLPDSLVKKSNKRQKKDLLN